VECVAGAAREQTQGRIARVAAWEEGCNAGQTGVEWQFTTADARVKLKRLCPEVQC